MTRRLNILHITAWFPSKENPKEALWVRRHIKALSTHYNNQVLHLQVIPSNRYYSKRRTIPEGIQHIVSLPWPVWRLAEWVTTFLLVYYLIRLCVNKKSDVINIHIAYPLLVSWHKFRRWIKPPVIVTEHWSAYHFNFNISEPTAVKRIKRIFYNGFPLITVSAALAEDIRRFSGNKALQTFQVPNVVETDVFNCKGEPEETFMSFFMVSLWKKPKDPITIIRAFAKVVENNPTEAFQLRIGGYGPLWHEMMQEVRRLNISSYVIFLGQLDSKQIAMEMNKAKAFVHCSAYETFSVVCAEALCCGLPVIASAVGGINEFLSEQNGVPIHKHNVEEWTNAIIKVTNTSFKREVISRHAMDIFSVQAVGEKYANVIASLVISSNIIIQNKCNDVEGTVI